MTFNSDPSTFLDKEQEALWYLGGQRIINALGERIEGAFRLTEFVTPAGTFVSAYRHKEDEAHYVIEGEATISCGGQVFHVSAGTFLFLPCNIPHHLELTLPWLKHRGFFLQPARLLVARLGVRGEAVCPEAFSSEEEVSLCPRVPTSANANARILSAAF